MENRRAGWRMQMSYVDISAEVTLSVLQGAVRWGWAFMAVSHWNGGARISVESTITATRKEVGP